MSEMTDDEARDRFSDAIEGELEEEDKAAFESALAKSEELREDYEAFRSVVSGAAKLAERTEVEVEDQAPDSLAAVQSRLHKRSKGRFYRDRFARDSSRRSTTTLIVILVLLTLAIGALALQNMVVIEEGPEETPRWLEQPDGEAPPAEHGPES